MENNLHTGSDNDITFHASHLVQYTVAQDLDPSGPLELTVILQYDLRPTSAQHK